MNKINECLWCGRIKCRNIGIRPDGIKLFKCPQCGLIFREGSAFDATYYDQASYYTQDQGAIEKANLRYQLIKYLYGNLSDKSILDVGCGPGYFIEKVPQACKVLGLDLSPWAIEQCRKKGLNVFQGTLENFYTSNKFDLITAWEVLEHVEDLRNFLHGIKEKLTTDGVFILSTPNAGSYRAQKNNLDWSGFRWSPEHICYFTAPVLNKILKEIFSPCQISFIEFDWRSEDTLVIIVELGVPVIEAKGNGAPSRVLYIGRTNGLTVPGGDMVQLFETRTALQKNGIAIDVSLCALPSLNMNYDLLHQFGLPNAESVDQLYHIRKHLNKTLLSTIYWNLEETKTSTTIISEIFKREKEEAKIEQILELFAKGKVLMDIPTKYNTPWERLQNDRKELLYEIAHFLPNSYAEMQELRKDFGIYRANYTIVPNAVKIDTFIASDPTWFVNTYGIKDFILCAARIEPRKNQLLLIMAAKKLGLPLVLIGKPLVPEYVELCHRFADANTLFIDNLPQELLASAYAAAKVHALVSWWETTGLSSLEAALNGCSLVVGDRGPTWEYFGDMAYYCDPGNLDSIIEAIDKAWNNHDPQKILKLQKIIRERYTWDKTAEKTLEAYKKVMLSKNAEVIREPLVIKSKVQHTSHFFAGNNIKEVAIFGAALTGNQCYGVLSNNGIKVKFFIDNSPAKQETLFLGLPVYSPEQAFDQNRNDIDAIILASGGYEDEIRRQLIQLGWVKPIISSKTLLG